MSNYPLPNRQSKPTERKKTHWHIKNNTPYHIQLRPRDTIKPLQLREDRRSHKQSLWKSKRILSVENTRRLIEDLLVDPKQRRIQRVVPLQLYSKGFGTDQSELIDAVSYFPRKSEERAVLWDLTDGFFASRLIADGIQ